MEAIAEWREYIQSPDRIHTTMWLGDQLVKANKFITLLLQPAPPPARDAWRTMESAPRDGTNIMLYAPPCVHEGHDCAERLTYGRWVVLEHGKLIGDCGGECRCPEYEDAPEPYWYSDDGSFTKEHPPTHWQPIPTPPLKQGDGE